jgi:hypothetical protein
MWDNNSSHCPLVELRERATMSAMQTAEPEIRATPKIALERTTRWIETRKQDVCSFSDLRTNG